MPIYAFAMNIDLISEIDPNSSSIELNTIVNELDHLPEDVLEILKSNKVTIKIIDKTNEFSKLQNGQEFGLAKAISPEYYIYTKTNKVEVYKYGYIECYTSDSYPYKYGALTHEVGHELDFLKAIETGYRDINEKGYGYSGSKEWQEIYQANLKNLASIDSFTKVNVPKCEEEGFAEAFRLSLTDPSKLKKTCPQVYAYLFPITQKDKVDKEVFNYVLYADRYPDLKKAFGYDKEKLYKHYIDYGIAEGRVAE